MWRVQGLVGRVLHRYHTNGALRLPQSHHHVEDEVINTSSLLSNCRHSSDSSSERERDGERRRRKKTSHFAFADLPHYTALDAVGLGAAAVLFMQVCRRIHCQFSSQSDHRHTTEALTEPSSLRRCGYRILLEILSRRDVLPSRSVLCLPSIPETKTQGVSITHSSSSEDSQLSNIQEDQLSFESSDHRRNLLDYDSSSFGDSWFSSSSLDDKTQKPETPEIINKQEVLAENEKFNESAQNLKHVGDSSVPVILNIIGLQSAEAENYEEAFCCFLAAAQLGYSKAQFNIGVCYEKGRGICRDIEKAKHYYGKAAANGHAQAQYRYAKLLLTSREQLNEEKLRTATSLLKEASAAGHTKAQVCLASIYSQNPEKVGDKSVQYLKMAAESGDHTALLFLGQCYEKGLGVTQNQSKAVDYYKQAAKAGNKQAMSFLESQRNKDMNSHQVLLRTIHSTPCFQPMDISASLSSGGSSFPVTLLPHSRSTGSICVPSALSSLPLHLHPQRSTGKPCKWTLGVG